MPKVKDCTTRIQYMCKHLAINLKNSISKSVLLGLLFHSLTVKPTVSVCVAAPTRPRSRSKIFKCRYKPTMTKISDSIPVRMPCVQSQLNKIKPRGLINQFRIRPRQKVYPLRRAWKIKLALIIKPRAAKRGNRPKLKIKKDRPATWI